MRPSNSIFYSGNLAGTHTIIYSYFFLRPHIGTNIQNLFFSQFSSSALFSSIRSAVFNPVSLIVGGSIPTKIVNMVIQWVSVIVAAFMSCFWIAIKCAKNYSSNAAKFVFVLFPQKNSRTTIIFGNRRFFYKTSFYCPNSPKIGCFVKVFESRYRFPNFISHSNIPITADMGIIT